MKKFVMAFNKRFEIPAQVNASGHLGLGISRILQEDHTALRPFTDAEGKFVSLLTDHPLIVFSAKNDRHLYLAHLAAMEQGIAAAAFFDCHRSADPVAQASAVSGSPAEDQVYIGLAMFAGDAELRPLTKRFSLMK